MNSAHVALSLILHKLQFSYLPSLSQHERIHFDDILGMVIKSAHTILDGSIKLDDPKNMSSLQVLDRAMKFGWGKDGGIPISARPKPKRKRLINPLFQDEI